jgi:hypothetical protein
MSPTFVAPRREALAFAGAVLALWLLFVVQAWNTPVQLDDWYQLTWHRHHAFGPSSLWTYFHFNYFHFNPRIGDLLLLIVNGPAACHLVLTPLVEVGLLWVAFAVGLGRWPRPTLRDLQLLLIIQVLIWIVIPIPGIIYFYRPFTTNYLWGFAITLALFVPYRLALARTAPAPRRLWAVPLMFALGWVSGMCNEHTGPTQMVAIVIFVAALWKAGRLRAWMVSGVVGLYVGYPMLFFAPGQALRYAGMATRNTPLNLLRERGFDGCLDIIIDFLGEAQLGIQLLAVIILVYLVARRRRGAPVEPPPRSVVMTTVALILAAGSIVVTQFASPTVGERLFFAPALLLVLGCAVLIDHMIAEPRVRRFVVIVASVIFAYHAVRFVWVYAIAKRDNDERIAILQRTTPDTIAVVPAYTYWKRTRWFWGDDLQYASLREYVANEVYDLRNIVYDSARTWAEPTPPDHYVATRIFDPPLPPEAGNAIAPVRYIPTFWEWTLVQLRRLIALRGLGTVDGHRLVSYRVDSEGLGFVDPAHRPIHVLHWTPARTTFVDGRPYDDHHGRPFIRVWQDSVPARLVETYVVSCGQTTKVVLEPDLDQQLGPLVPLRPACNGTYTAVMCEPDACWFAGRRYLP